MPTLISRPNPGTGTAPIDGQLRQFSGATTWSGVRDGAGTLANNTVATTAVTIFYFNTGWLYFDRSGMGVDSSSIPASDTITNIDVDLYIVANNVDSFGVSVNITPFSPANEGNFVGTDYDAFTDTKLTTDVAISSLTTGAYNTFSLNAAGIAHTNKSGNTMYYVRFAADIDDAEPAASGTQSSTLTFSAADQTGTTQDPTVTFTYSAPSGNFWDKQISSLSRYYG